MPKLSLGDEDGVDQLLDLRVPRLCVREDLTDKIDRTLHLLNFARLFSLDDKGRADNLGCPDDIQQHGFSFC